MRGLRLITEKRLEKLVQERVEQKIQKLNKDYERDILKKKIDMAVLQGQINPHFLYNALECIRGQALEEDVPQIADTTKALSQFFRYSISTKSDLVTLKEEIENIMDYMKIQQYRFKGRFKLDIKINKSNVDIMNALLLPKLTLQPIVENSIIHGFSKQSHNAKIEIKVVVTKNHCNITISDSGRGIEQQSLFKLNDALSDVTHIPVFGKEQSKRRGIALQNVNRRLKLFFGDDSGISIYSWPNMGTDVEIHIPNWHKAAVGGAK